MVMVGAGPVVLLSFPFPPSEVSLPPFPRYRDAVRNMTSIKFFDNFLKFLTNSADWFGTWSYAQFSIINEIFCEYLSKYGGHEAINKKVNRGVGYHE